MSDPFTGYQFIVNLDSPETYLPPEQAALIPVMVEAGFQEVTGLGAQLEVTSYAEGGLNDFVHQLPLRHSWNRIVLKRGVTNDQGLWLWYLAGLSQSIGARRDGSITLHDAEGTPVVSWFFRGGLAAKWDGPAFNAQQGAVAIESLEIAHEGIDQILLKGASA
jgi:phage tail-like protein